MSASAATKVPLWVTEGLEKRGWNQAELARRTGLNPNTISYVLNGRRPPNPTTLQLIAQAFDADPEGTALAVGSVAVKGGVEHMIHDDSRFGDLYLIWQRASNPAKDRIWRFAHGEDRKRRSGKREPTEGDT